MSRRWRCEPGPDAIDELANRQRAGEIRVAFFVLIGLIALSPRTPQPFLYGRTLQVDTGPPARQDLWRTPALETTISYLTNLAIRPFGPAAQPSPLDVKPTLLYFSRSSGFQLVPLSVEKWEPDVPTATHRSFAQATPERNGNGLSIPVQVLPPSLVIAAVAPVSLGLR